MSDNLDIPDNSRGYSNGNTTDNTASELKYAQILDGCVDCVITINERGTIDFFNASSEKMWGYHRSEVIGKNVKMLMGTEHSIQHDTYLSNYTETRVAKVIGSGRDLEAQTKDGHRVPILLTLSEAKLDNGKSIFTAFIKDLTAQKELERQSQQQMEEIRANEEELRQNMEELSATQEKQEQLTSQLQKAQGESEAQFKAIDGAFAFIEFDTEGNIINANAIFLTTIGYSLAEIKGRHHRLFVTQEYAQSLAYQEFWINLRKGKTNTGQFQRLDKNGNTVWLDASYAPIIDKNGSVI